MADYSYIPPRYRRSWRVFSWSSFVSTAICFGVLVAFPGASFFGFFLAAGLFAVTGLAIGALAMRRHIRMLHVKVRDKIATCPACSYILEDPSSTQCSECGMSCSVADALLIDRRYLRLLAAERSRYPAEWRGAAERRFSPFRPSVSTILFLAALGASLFFLVFDSGLPNPKWHESAAVKTLGQLLFFYAMLQTQDTNNHDRTARQILDENLRLNPDAVNPRGLRKTIAVNAEQIPRYKDGIEDFWIEHGPLPWHVVAFDKDTQEIRTVLPVESQDALP